MDKREINVMRSILRYDVNRAYMGDLTGAELNGAFEIFVRSQDWDKPIVSAPVHTGFIDGPMICRAVWNEMSYNPKRFGTVSPFLHNGKENICYFCDKKNELPKDTPGYDTVVKVREKMISFLNNNSRESGQWYTIVDSNKGNVVVRFVSGCSDRKYKMLAALRDMIHIVASQNLKDLDRAAYRKEMKPIIDARHPNGIRAKKEPYFADKILAAEKRKREEEQARQERLDDAEDSAMITADSRIRSSMSLEQYNQAQNDLERIKMMSSEHRSK